VIRRAVSAVIAACLVVASLLALHHEATVAHVRDRATGELVHARHLAERHHASPIPHIHGRASDDDDDDACPLTGAMHHGAVVDHAVVTAALGQTQIASVCGDWLGGVVARLYRLAPKTSPPAAA